MLLASEAAMPIGRVFRLAFDESAAVIGALSWRDEGTALGGLRIHVVPDRRRQGIGSAMLDHAAAHAISAGRDRLIAEIDLKTEPEAEAFLLSRGFKLTGTLTSINTPVDRLVAATANFQEKLARAGSFPESTRLVRLDEAPHDQIVRMFIEYISHVPLLAGMMRSFKLEQYPDSVVLMMGDRVIGFVLAQVVDAVLYIPAWVVAKEFQDKRIGTLLLGALGPAVAGRIIERIRFEFTDSAPHTARLASQADHEIVRIAARFELNVTGGA